MQYSLDQADVIIDIAQQSLKVVKTKQAYCISSGKTGIGEQENSGKTPRGWHRIAQKIGAEHAKNAVFIGRQWTGEIYNADLAAEYPERDWILSRILWLDGLEENFNCGDGCDTFKRYIYIHGTPDTEPMGIPMSHGCIRMHNTEVIDIFNLLNEGDLVYLVE